MSYTLSEQYLVDEGFISQTELENNLNDNSKRLMNFCDKFSNSQRNEDDYIRNLGDE